MARGLMGRDVHKRGWVVCVFGKGKVDWRCRRRWVVGEDGVGRMMAWMVGQGQQGRGRGWFCDVAIVEEYTGIQDVYDGDMDVVCGDVGQGRG